MSERDTGLRHAVASDVTRDETRNTFNEDRLKVARELRALADKLYPPIVGGKVVRDFGPSRVTRKSHARQSFRIHVGK
jgi:hypothetical protein